MSLFQSLAIFWMTLLFTQTPDTLWTKRYGGPFGDLGVYVQETSDLGYIIAAHTQSDSGAPMQHYLIKTDSLGEIIWTKTFCRSDPFSGCIQETADSGYILTGGTVDTTGHMVIYLLKLNAQGDSLWAETIDGGGSGKSVQQTTDLGYIITG
ncbi:MAG TPA: hypothetical protein ENI34_03100, partial [candidate division WOR-3 bacterium]|nr:hypothetical protein [candidate division WOR-3 bacterium]